MAPSGKNNMLKFVSSCFQLPTPRAELLGGMREIVCRMAAVALAQSD